MSQSEVVPSNPQLQPHQDTETNQLTQLDNSLFTTGRERPRLTRAQKQQTRRQHAMESMAETPSLLDISADELKSLQLFDPSLDFIREAVRQKPDVTGRGFFAKEGLLYRRYLPPGSDDENGSVEQLILPTKCRKAVLQLAHSIPLAGHLGRNKTVHRILQRFYWPTVYKDAQGLPGMPKDRSPETTASTPPTTADH